jgi:hypothetical protein
LGVGTCVTLSNIHKESDQNWVTIFIKLIEIETENSKYKYKTLKRRRTERFFGKSIKTNSLMPSSQE